MQRNNVGFLPTVTRVHSVQLSRSQTLHMINRMCLSYGGSGNETKCATPIWFLHLPSGEDDIGNQQ